MACLVFPRLGDTFFKFSTAEQVDGYIILTVYCMIKFIIQLVLFGCFLSLKLCAFLSQCYEPWVLFTYTWMMGGHSFNFNLFPALFFFFYSHFLQMAYTWVSFAEPM